MKKTWTGIFVIIAVLMLAACGSIDKEAGKAEAAAKKAFEKQPAAPNEKAESIEFHLPKDLAIKEKKPNNIMLNKEKHTYLLFYNPNEESSSEALYKVLKNNEEDIVLDKTYKADDRFGYYVVSEAEGGKYEITAGIGGVKGTTETTAKNLAADSKLLMEIVRSAVITSK